MSAKENTNEPMFTRDQKRAQFAWEFIKGLTPEQCGDLADICKQGCTRIMNSGFAGTLAFSLAKKEDEKHKQLAAALAIYFGKVRKLPIGTDPEKLLEMLISSEAMELRSHTDEAMSVLQWLARIAEGKAPKKNTERVKDNA